MANHKSAIKRIRTSLKQNQRNRHYRSLMRSTIKKVLATTEQEAAQAQYVQATSLLDKMASKRIIHANKAANQKSRLAKHVNSLAS
ncbi:MAG: 30S ribosomal protein S20 [Deferribacteres bacterium]|nr:30S ribosomal protein S20 [candidate division KSB1 bacterium]MCB9510715.1 30S ribosomal protein S20 [Deferribacteres bacterium]